MPNLYHFNRPPPATTSQNAAPAGRFIGDYVRCFATQLFSPFL